MLSYSFFKLTLGPIFFISKSWPPSSNFFLISSACVCLRKVDKISTCHFIFLEILYNEVHLLLLKFLVEGFINRTKKHSTFAVLPRVAS